MLLIQEIVNQPTNAFLLAQLIPLLSTIAGTVAVVVGVWSKKASEKNGCTLKILMAKLEADKAARDAELEKIKSLVNKSSE